MKTYTLRVAILAAAGLPCSWEYRVRANSFTMAAGLCKGQAAIEGWRILEVLNYEVTE